MTMDAPTRGPGKGTLWQGVLDAVNLPIVEERGPLSEQLRRVIRGHMTAEERSLEEYPDDAKQLFWSGNFERVFGAT